MKCWTFCDLFQIKNYTYTHKFWIPHIFSILVSFLFNFSLKKLRFVSFRFSVFFFFICLFSSVGDKYFALYLTWPKELDHLHSTVQSCSYPAQHKFLRSKGACTCMNKFVSSRHTRKHLHFYNCRLFGSPNKKQWQTIRVKKLFRTRIWMYFGIIPKKCSAFFLDLMIRARCNISDQKLIAVSMKM